MNRATRTAELAKATQNDPRWALIVARDALVDRTFYYSVKTTGVYCRPSCAARLARPENVQFHGTCEEAEKAGFRPCKRCKPTGARKARQKSVGNRCDLRRRVQFKQLFLRDIQCGIRYDPVELPRRRR